MARNRFRLDTTVLQDPFASVSSGNPSHVRNTNALDPRYSSFRIPSAALPKKQYGDYQSDVDSGKFNCSWTCWQDFEDFLGAEQDGNSVEFCKTKTRTGGDKFHTHIYFVCSRHGTGGVKTYEKKHPNWTRKIPAKRTGCGSALTIKTYHNTEMVLGIYKSNHNHSVGEDNLRFTRICDDTREWIAGMVRIKVSNDRIVSFNYVNPQ